MLPKNNDKVVARFLDPDGRVAQMPAKQSTLIKVLAYIAQAFSPDRDYTEGEVNEICTSMHSFNDFHRVRRDLVDFKFLSREKDGSRYWVPKSDDCIPKNLKHKPVFAIENYAQVDGRKAGDTDAKGLSLGLAQWNERGRVEISAKVWRYTGEKWSRQSEELPLHRVIDLALLILSAKKQMSEAYRYEKLYDLDNPVFDRIPVQGDALTVQVCTDNEFLDEDLRLFTQAMTADDELLSERFHRLGDMLRELGYGRREG